MPEHHEVRDVVSMEQVGDDTESAKPSCPKCGAGPLPVTFNTLRSKAWPVTCPSCGDTFTLRNVRYTKRKA